MNDRQEQILKIITESYIERAEPVGSAFVVENYDLGVSPATVRNDMAALESAGYIHQPHVSAGRVPTEEGYRYYLSQLLHTKSQAATKKKLGHALESKEDEEEALKDLARELVALSGEAVVISFGPRRVYYAGLSNLFSKPDFQDLAIMQALSGSVDQFEDVLMGLVNMLADEPEVFIGCNNPFGEQMSSVMLKYSLPETAGVLGFVGPMRMNYGRNMQLLKTTNEIIEELFS